MTIVNALKQADIFFELTPTQLALIASVCQERNYPSGAIVFEENSASNELYVILQGEVEIRVDPALVAGTEVKSSPPVKIATLSRGQSFGEVALVDQGLRSASAHCITATHLLAIPREKLILLCETYPQLGYRLMRNLAADLAMKIRNTDLLIREQLLYSQHRTN